MWHIPEIWLPSVVSNITVYGVIVMSYLEHLHLETLPDRGWRTNAFPDRLTVYLIPSVSIPGLSWLFGFWLSHFVGIPIFGNTLWYVLTCRWGQTVEVAKESWIWQNRLGFSALTISSGQRDMKILVNRVGRWRCMSLWIHMELWPPTDLGYLDPDGRAKSSYLCCRSHLLTVMIFFVMIPCWNNLATPVLDSSYDHGCD